MSETETNLLHNHVLTALFKESYLVDLHEQTPEDKQTNASITNDVLVVHHHENSNLPASQEALLQGILGACKLKSNEVVIYCKTELDTNSLPTLLEKHQPKKIILFGVDPAAVGLPMHFPVFQLQAYQLVHYLHAPSLSALESDKQLKVALWQKLQQLFPS